MSSSHPERNNNDNLREGAVANTSAMATTTAQLSVFAQQQQQQLQQLQALPMNAAMSGSHQQQRQQMLHVPIIPRTAEAAAGAAYAFAAAAAAAHRNHHPMMASAQTPASHLQQPLSPLLKTNAAASLVAMPLLYARSGERKLRSGKWTDEEEEYAAVLIELFEKGLVRDCVNGCTLRSYLSQKLGCAPMRISKKFAGKGIGKMIYTEKLTNGSNKRQDGPPPELAEKLKEKELKFRAAIRPDTTEPMFPPVVHIPFVPHGSLLPAGTHAPSAPPLQPPTPATPPVPVPFQPPAAATPSVTIPSQANTMPHGGSHPGATVNKSHHAAASDAVAEEHKKQLQESYLRALQLQQQEQQQVKQHQTPPAAATTTTAATAAHHGAPVRAAATVVNVRQASKDAVVAQSSNVGKQKENVACDLLSGLKHQLPAIPTPQQQQETVDTTTEYSPALTSRSFDELHKFWGQDDLTMLHETTPATTEANVSKEEQQKPSEKEHDTTALFSAESYAMFAQESAMAASHHTAYSLHGSIVDNDVEHMLNLVHEHNCHGRSDDDDDQEKQLRPQEKEQNKKKRKQEEQLTPVERFTGAAVSEPSASESNVSRESSDGAGTTTTTTTDGSEIGDDDSDFSSGSRRKMTQIEHEPRAAAYSQLNGH